MTRKKQSVKVVRAVKRRNVKAAQKLDPMPGPFEPAVVHKVELPPTGVAQVFAPPGHKAVVISGDKENMVEIVPVKNEQGWLSRFFFGTEK
jgi:hypothetical protein